MQYGSILLCEKMKLFYLFTFILCFFTTSCRKQSRDQIKFLESYDILQTIPVEDRQLLDSFFQLLLRDNNFAYTLFGKKPMSIACYLSKVNLWNLYNPNEFLIFEKGWDKWKDYSSLFPSNEFVLKRCCDSKDIVEVFLINKKNVLKVINDNYGTFQSILGNLFEPEQFMQQLCYTQQDLMEILNDHSGLLGILLGYGKGNSMSFERKVNICSILNAKMTPPFTAMSAMKCLQPKSEYLISLYNTKTFSSPKKIFLPSLSETLMAEELNVILENENLFELYGSNFFVDRFIGPVFMTQSGDLETMQLQNEYLATRQRIHRAYQEKPFLEITLNQWMHPQ